MHKQEHAFPQSVFLSNFPFQLSSQITTSGKAQVFLSMKGKNWGFSFSLSMTKNVFVFTLHLPTPSWHISACIPLAIRASNIQALGLRGVWQAHLSVGVEISYLGLEPEIIHFDFPALVMLFELLLFWQCCNFKVKIKCPRAKIGAL